MQYSVILFNQSHFNEYFICSFAFVCFAIVGFVFAYINNEFLVHFGTFMLLFPQDKFLEVELLTH